MNDKGYVKALRYNYDGTEKKGNLLVTKRAAEVAAQLDLVITCQVIKADKIMKTRERVLVTVHLPGKEEYQRVKVCVRWNVKKVLSKMILKSIDDRMKELNL